jgi:hypothetical protein
LARTSFGRPTAWAILYEEQVSCVVKTQTRPSVIPSLWASRRAWSSLRVL